VSLSPSELRLFICVAASSVWNWLCLWAFDVVGTGLAIEGFLLCTLAALLFSLVGGAQNLPPRPWPGKVPLGAAPPDFPPPSRLNELGAWLSVKVVPLLALPFLWPTLLVQRIWREEDPASRASRGVT
jgi:hypothetical protein